MSTFTNSLFRIDPTEGLLQYVQSIKPYHSKVLDVFVEYVYTEAMHINMIDIHRSVVGLESTCTTLQVDRADVATNTVIVSGFDIPRLQPGDIVSFKHSNYIDTTASFTIASIGQISTSSVSIELIEPLSIEDKKHPADRLSNQDVNDRIKQGVLVCGCYPRKPTVYSCGYGLVWDSPSNVDVPSSTIVAAEGIDDRVVSISAGSADIVIAPNSNRHTIQQGDVVTFLTTSTLPVAATPIHVGHPFYVVYVVGNVIRVSSTISGSPVVFTNAGTGVISIRRISPTLNSFTVTSSPATQFPVAVLSTTSNQMFISNRAPITTTSSIDNSVTTAGVITSLVGPGDTVTISSNTDINANKTYTVAAATAISGSTKITFVESLPVTITASGYVNYKYDEAQLPGWRTGMAVTITATPTYTPSNLYPAPIAPATTYYVNLTSIPGVFNLSTKRFSTNPNDLVDITSVGTGTLTVQRVEPYAVGDAVTITNSIDRGTAPNTSTNDGTYTISKVVPLGGNVYRIHTVQSIPHNTPTGVPSDGIITRMGTYGNPHCILVSSHPLHTDTVFSERLVFDFEDDTDTVTNEDIAPYDVTPLM